MTFLLGSAVGYAAPFIWGAMEPSMGRIMAIRITFTALASIGAETGFGYRLAAAVAAVICLTGAFVLSRYDEKKVLGIIVPERKNP